MGRGENASEQLDLAPAREREREPAPAELAAGLLARSPLSEAPGEVILLSLAGSRAYGLEREDSDWDVRGVYIAEPRSFLGLTPAPEQLEGGEGDDLVVFELSKLARLAVKSNPNIFEILWTPTLYSTEAGEELKPLRELCLSQKLRLSYTGFAISQKKLIARHVQGERTRQAQKAALHALRLLQQGEELLRTRRMSVQIPNAAELKSLAEDPERVAAELDQAIERFDQIPSELPERADAAAISELILKVRSKGIKRLAEQL